jgi:hypothetical protein
MGRGAFSDGRGTPVRPTVRALDLLGAKYDKNGAQNDKNEVQNNKMGSKIMGSK